MENKLFTGIVEEIGKVIRKVPVGSGYEFCVESSKLVKSIENGDSIAVNGVCQTVERYSEKSFFFTTVEETIKKTNLGDLKNNDFVNLESSLNLNKKISGHLVYGHVDCVGRLKSIKKQTNATLISIEYPTNYKKYLVHVGSICLNGVSLTVADFSDNVVTCAIIPHTWENTIFDNSKVNDKINIEFDIIGKYVDRMLNNKDSQISEEWLKSKGF